MFLVPFVLISQAYRQQVLKFEGFRGIYQPDFSTCSKRDWDSYKGIFQAGPLNIMKSEFSVTIFHGTWTQKGKKLYLRTEKFMQRNLHRKPSDQSHETFLGGFVFEIGKAGILRLVPGHGMYQKSKLTFRPIKPIKIIEGLALFAKSNAMDPNYEMSTANAVYGQFYDYRNSLSPTMLGILKSGEPLPIRTEAARQLISVRTEKVVGEVGDLLLKQDQSKDREKAVFRRFLSAVVRESHLRSSFDIGVKAYEAKLISLSTMIGIAGNSGNPKAVAFLEDASADAKGSALVGILVQLRELSGPEALAFALSQEKSQDAEMQFEVLRTRAEAEPSLELRDKAVQSLIDLFPKSEWMSQCDIAKSLGTAQTKLAHQGLLKINGKGIDEAVQQWIDEALSKYKK